MISHSVENSLVKLVSRKLRKVKNHPLESSAKIKVIH